MSLSAKGSHILGAAVKVRSQPSVTTGSTITLLHIKNPAGTTIVENQVMSLAYDSAAKEYIADYIFESTTSMSAGRYTYITKIVNGSKTSLARGQFFMEAQ